MKSKDLKAFDITQESPQTQQAYGDHAFGQGCLLARRLVEHGVRFIEVEDDQNWDTHNDQLVSMQRMTPRPIKRLPLCSTIFISAACSTRRWS